MIKMIVSLAGTDPNGESFAASPGDQITLDDKSEKNLVEAGFAAWVKAPAKKKAAKK